MLWTISDHKLRPLLPILILTICFSMLAGCKKQPKLVITPPPPLPVEIVREKAPLGRKEIHMDIKLTRLPDQRKVRKVRSQSMPTGTRISYPTGADILRFLQYDEEIITLPKMQSTMDFNILLLTRDQNPPLTVSGYSNVTYELMESSLPGGAILLDSFYGTLNDDQTLSKTVLLPTDRKDVFKKVQAEISPKNLKFKKVIRTNVIPGTEHNYVIKFLGKKGMTILFEIRHLKGGSRPKVIHRQTVEIPLGTPLIEINGHKFKIHTATTEFIDIERLS
ncbi:hypothetical protein [Maridesulfovibrio sp.]|uniref:hypothetical protein n=1 Tax=Maridesulfovibrio sp. TaxID=2795000 RepID=UPI0029F474A1|nr:hypothetical protein [Maridesulfovibrio sp.]